MVNKRLFVIILIFWVGERLIQSVFLYNFSFAMPVLFSSMLLSSKSQEIPWSVLAGGIIFDLSSGLPFGTFFLLTIIGFSFIFLVRRVANISDSLPNLLLAAILLSLIGWFIVSRLNKVMFPVFSSQVVSIVAGTILISLLLNYLNDKYKLKQI